jgi:hypothetical protein
MKYWNAFIVHLHIFNYAILTKSDICAYVTVFKRNTLLISYITGHVH